MQSTSFFHINQLNITYYSPAVITSQITFRFADVKGNLRSKKKLSSNERA